MNACWTVRVTADNSRQSVQQAAALILGARPGGHPVGHNYRLQIIRNAKHLRWWNVSVCVEWAGDHFGFSLK